MHNHRAEHWIVVGGIAKIQINEKKFTLTENQSTFYRGGTKTDSSEKLPNQGSNILAKIRIRKLI